VTETVADSSAEAFQDLLRELSPESRTFFAEAALGRDAREFAASDLGRYMIGCAKQDVADAQEKLARVSPWRRHRIQQLQNEIRVAEQFLGYIRDLIIRGKAAELTLEDREDT
jgi:hypothetical protein